jgi:hypothetical protein
MSLYEGVGGVPALPVGSPARVSASAGEACSGLKPPARWFFLHEDRSCRISPIEELAGQV